MWVESWLNIWKIKFLGFFSDKEYKNSKYLGKFKDVFKYAKENDVDEIYCSLSNLKNDEIKKVNKFANERGIGLK